MKRNKITLYNIFYYSVIVFFSMALILSIFSILNEFNCESHKLERVHTIQTGANGIDSNGKFYREESVCVEYKYPFIHTLDINIRTLFLIWACFTICVMFATLIKFAFDIIKEK